MSEDATVPHAFEAVFPTGVVPDRHDDALVVALVSDLMLGSRLEAVSGPAGAAVRVIPDWAAARASLGARSAAVVLDLTDPVFTFATTYALVRERAPGAGVIAFYPHVRDDLREIARDAGCDVVMPRSRFLTDPVSAMRSALDIAAVRAAGGAGRRKSMTSVATAYETVIGLEVHAQLMTRSKMFCSCPIPPSDAEPNSYVCPVCLGMPGVLPVINEQAVEFTIMTGLALNCEIPELSKFDRKNYHYPDLMKGYQISQYDQPLTRDGWLEIELDGQVRRLGITRVHLEEDTARSQHYGSGSDGYSLIDVNRGGVPLMEIVSEPDMRSPEEARAYLVKLRQILRFLGTSNANLEEGNFRCDANVSLRPVGSTEFGSKVEVKNMNSFRAVYRALQYEMDRQAKALDAGQRIPQETRGWVEPTGRTVSQRSKEFAHDYRYFPEPDLPPLRVTPEQVQALRDRLPELPDALRLRLEQQYGLTPYEANLLGESRERAAYFEQTVDASPTASEPQRSKQIANWMLGELARLANAAAIELAESRVTPQQLSGLLDILDGGTITAAGAKQALETMFASGKDAAAVVQQLNLATISGTDELTVAADRVLAANPKAVADFGAGKAEALQFLVGQFMRETRGRANPNQARELLQARITNA